MKTPLLRFSVISFFSISFFFGNSSNLWAEDNNQKDHNRPLTSLRFNRQNVDLESGNIPLGHASPLNFQEILERRRPFLKCFNELKAEQEFYCGSLSDEELIQYYKENFTGPKFLSSPSDTSRFYEIKGSQKTINEKRFI